MTRSYYLEPHFDNTWTYTKTYEGDYIEVAALEYRKFMVELDKLALEQPNREIKWRVAE